MPRRKQGHSQAAKRITNSAERLQGKGLVKKRASNDVRPTAPTRTSGRKGGRGGSRARAAVLKASRLANENTAVVPDVRTRYLHKKFQRVGCLSPTPSLDSNTHADPDEPSEKGKVYSELKCTDNQNCSKSSTVALEALLQVTELEINKSSARDVTLPKDHDVSRTPISTTETHSTTWTEKSIFADLPRTSPSAQNLDPYLPGTGRKEDICNSQRQQTVSVAETQSSSTPVSCMQDNDPKKSKAGRHVCPYCSHGFAKPSVLKKHIRAHTNERPYPCRLCGFSFKTKSNLYKHCKSRAHVLKVNESGIAGADSLLPDVDTAHSNTDTEDDVDRLSVSENSCDTSSANSLSLPPEISCVPKQCVEESKERLSPYTDPPSNSKSSSSDQHILTSRPRVPPIKIQTLIHNTKRLASVISSEHVSSAALPSESSSGISQAPVTHCSIGNKEISSVSHTSKGLVVSTLKCVFPNRQTPTLNTPCASSAISSPPPGKNTSGVSSLIYKPKFHSAIIGGSRKFIDHKNFTLDLSQEENCASSSCSAPSHDEKSSEVQDDSCTSSKQHHSSQLSGLSSNDGLMLRVVDEKSNISQDHVENPSPSHPDKSLPTTITTETDAVKDHQSVNKSSFPTGISSQSAVKTGVGANAITSVSRSSGLSLQVTNKTPVKSPRLVSPELLKQHISNLISANTAIVETLNPLWSRRFLRQSSVASSQNVDAELRARNKHRRYGNYGGGEDLSQSKLANALLRKDGVGLQLTGSQSLPATPSIILTSPPFANVLLTEVKSQLLNVEASRASPLPSPIPNKSVAASFCKAVGNLNMPEKSVSSSDASNISVLNTSVENVSEPVSVEKSVSEEKSGHCDVPGSLQHPQNPEGSIIKNLLLTKRRSPSATTTLSTGSTVSPVQYINSPALIVGEIASDRSSAQTVPDSHSYQFHTCPVCHTSFRSMETLQAHQSHYCQKGQRLSPAAYNRESEVISVMRNQSVTTNASKVRVTTSGEITSKPRGRPKGSKNRPKELLVIPAITTNSTHSQSPSNAYISPSPLTPSFGHLSGFPSPLLNTDAHGKTLNALKGKLNFRQGNDVQELNTQEKLVCDPHSKQLATTYSSETPNADSSDEGTILKKHLLLGGISGDKSPPLKKRRIPEETLRTSEPGTVQNSLSTLRSLEELSRYPMRSNSVQMFGGEVEICDSGESKKMRIDAKLQHPVPSGGGLILGTSSSPALSLQMMPVLGSRGASSTTCSMDGGLPSPSVVVTIAKLVLNSGGTMMQVQESKSHSTPPVCIPVVALGHPHASSEMAAVSDCGASPLTSPSERPLSSTKFNDVGAVILSPSITTVHPDKVSGIHSIDISHLQLCSTTTLSYSSPTSPLVLGPNPSPLLPHNQLAISRMTPSPSVVHSPLKRHLSASPLVNTSGGATITMSSSLSPIVVVTGSSDSATRTFLPSVVSSIVSLRSSPGIFHPAKENPIVKSGGADFAFDPSKLTSNQSSQVHEESSTTIESRILKNTAIPIIQIDSAAPPVTLTVCSTSSTASSTPSASTSTSTSGKQPGKAFLAPPRPTSLPLKSSHSSMVGTTLISPETPRPKKKYGQLYINGQYYTYLGLKCSTRVYYCCIYRPQPMYVPQSTDPKLSMYSNWQTVPVNPDKINLTPAAAMACYDSRHRSNRYAVAGPKKLEYLLTHSSYWTFKQQKSSLKEAPKTKDVENAEIKPEGKALIIEVCEEPPASKADVVAVKDECKVATPAEDSAGTETSPVTVKQKRSEMSETRREPKRVKIFEGGFKSNEEYTYVRGRGRGKYVCEECGIRCKKPSMLKKHIRTHTDVRPFTCKHCNFSFKTKGNLTKHMKSKAHHKKCIELGIDPVPVSIDEAHIDEEALAKQERYEKEFGQFADDDDTDDEFEDDDDEEEDENEDDEEDEDDEDDSFDEDSDEKSMINHPQVIRPKGQFEDATETVSSVKSHSSVKREEHQLMVIDIPAEHEAARSLLDLSNHGKPGNPVKSEQILGDKDDDLVIIGERPRIVITSGEFKGPSSSGSGCEELIGNPRVAWQTNQTRTIMERSVVESGSGSATTAAHEESITEQHSTVSYPVYELSPEAQKCSDDETDDNFRDTLLIANKTNSSVPADSPSPEMDPMLETEAMTRYPEVSVSVDDNKDAAYLNPRENHTVKYASSEYPITEPIVTLTVDDEPERVQVNGSDLEQPMDLSFASGRAGDSSPAHHIEPHFAYVEEDERLLHDEVDLEDSYVIKKRRLLPAKCVDSVPPRLAEPQAKADDLYEAITPPLTDVDAQLEEDQSEYESTSLSQAYRLNGGRVSSSRDVAQRWNVHVPESENGSVLHAYLTETDGDSKMLPGIVMSYQQGPDPRLSPSHSKLGTFTLRASPIPSTSTSKYSYLQTGTNSFHSPRAQSASPHEADVSGKHQSEFLLPSDCKSPAFSHRSMDDGKCVCNICNKSFTKPSQLRLHVNIHYFERPFRCDSCAVSFRTKGHLQKHRRSVSHYNKVNMNMTFGTPTTDNPRPFKCGDCKIAFRIHGHLAKHLRSKMHIMKLECLGKLPFGTYAEIERSGVNLNEIDTTDCENSLESLQVMAQRMYEKDPRRQHWTRERTISGCSADDGSDISHVTDESLEGGRYRSMSLGDVGRLSPDYQDMEEVMGGDGPGLAEVKQEPRDVPGSGELYNQKRWEVAHHSSMESLGQEYEDISDAESEPEPTTSCTLCGQLFRSVKALHLHLYVEHPEGREIPPEAPPRLENKSVPQSRVHCPMRVRSMSMSDNPGLSMEVRTGSFPGEMSVAMEMRRNVFADGAAIAMEIRRNSGNFITEISANDCRSIPHDSHVLESRRAPPHPSSLSPIVEHCPNNVADVGVVIPSRKVGNIPERVDCGVLVSVSSGEEGVDHHSSYLQTVSPQSCNRVRSTPDAKVAHFSCDVCEKDFSTHGSLKQHMRNHTQLRPFVCEICDAGFISKEYLWHHYQTHNQEKESINPDGDRLSDCKETRRSHSLSTYCIHAEEDTVR